MRLPVFSTLLVAAAVATMIALGFWQLRRADEKEAIVARYEHAIALSSEVVFPRGTDPIEPALYRHSSLLCEKVLTRRTTPGHRHDGQQGLAQMVRCVVDGGGEADVALGWSLAPEPVKWDGGPVMGFVAPQGHAAKLVAAPPVAGLEQLATPDPRDLPNNHLAYAVQWFFFAATALVIYLLALRRRGHQPAPKREESA